jgi:tetratricopeptide (TPR) repeat protein
MISDHTEKERSKLVDLQTAANQIRQACENAQSYGLGRPFFFLVGAGISNPPIPLASSIESDCKSIASTYNRVNGPIKGQPIETYSHWFQTALPHAVLRQRYLRELIEGKSISPANFRLAHLLLDRKIANLIVTTNFDDFLSRALLLFGDQPIVCDHPLTVERIDPEKQHDIQIVHVHGTYWFYDCANLYDEIRDRAKSSKSTTSTMAFLLDNILLKRSPIVVGYSGWEGDVVMTALERRLQRPLPYNLYWFCFKRSAFELLPDWLKFHAQVYFVVPQQEPGESGEAESPSAGKIRDSSNNDINEPVLSAKDVFDELNRTFELEPPSLTRDPLDFFARQLRHSLLSDIKGESEDDIYSIKSVIERVERARDIISQVSKENLSQLKVEGAGESQLEAVRDYVRRSQYHEAIFEAKSINIFDLKTSQLKDLLHTTLSALTSLHDTSADVVEGYNLVVAINDLLSKTDISDPDLSSDIEKARVQIAEGLLSLGNRFSKIGEHQKAITIYDQVGAHFGDSTEPAMRSRVAKSLLNKGSRLADLERYKEAREVFSDVLEHFGRSKDRALIDLTNRAELLRVRMDTVSRNAKEKTMAPKKARQSNKRTTA